MINIEKRTITGDQLEELRRIHSGTIFVSSSVAERLRARGAIIETLENVSTKSVPQPKRLS